MTRAGGLSAGGGGLSDGPGVPNDGGACPPVEGLTSAGSLYERVLGADFALLDPQIQRYFGEIPAGYEGRGRGVYEWAGPRHAFLRPVFLWLAWRRVLFPERGREVPFTVVNSSGPDGTLSARREFEFPRVTRVMEDTMDAVRAIRAEGTSGAVDAVGASRGVRGGHAVRDAGDPGAGGVGGASSARLVDRLGKRRGLEVEVGLQVSDGGLRMRSSRLALLVRVPRRTTRLAAVGHLRVPLPRVVTMTLDERAHPSGDGRQCVDVRLRAPLLGDVFRYVGEFEYAVVPVAGR